MKLFDYLLFAYSVLTTVLLYRYHICYEVSEKHFYQAFTLLNRTQNRVFELQREVHELEKRL